jgi:protein-S-isoprenylcysteine O-methyltransferase Ste14
MYLIYWFAAYQEEQMFVDELGNQYVEYTNKAISIFPKFSPSDIFKNLR